IRLGLVPGWGGISALPRRTGLNAALDLLLGGEPMGAGEAAATGLVDRVVHLQVLEAAVRELTASQPRALPWPPGDWEATIARAWATMAGDVARARLLNVLETDLRDGPEAGLLAATVALADLAWSPKARSTISEFVSRRKPPPSP